jgi:signal transduction histidine kinase
MGTILFLSNAQNENIRWASLIGFFGGCGGLSVLFDKDLQSPDWVLFLHGLFSSFGHYWTPYAILIFGLLYSNTIRTNKHKRLCKFLFLIPIFIMYIIYQVYPEFIVNYAVLSIWVAPYVTVSNILLIYSVLQETRPVVKRQRILTCLVIVPMTSFALFTNIILEAVGVAGLWMYNPWIIGLQFLLFLFFLMKYGFLGIQMRFEKQRHDSTIKAIASGTALLNHTIKNEVSKIKFFFNIAKDSIEKKDLIEAKNSIESVFSAIEGIDNMVDRIRSKTQEIVLKETNVKLEKLLRSCIDEVQSLCDIKGIEIKSNIKSDVMLHCDKVLLADVFNNILNNAMEAITVPKGQIYVQLFKKKNVISIEISDNGIGIPKKELKRIMEPFFSTKKNIKNHGLGLSFCYQTIRAHGGEIFVHSEVNKGTSVIIQLPRNRINPTKLDV